MPGASRTGTATATGRTRRSGLPLRRRCRMFFALCLQPRRSHGCPSSRRAGQEQYAVVVRAAEGAESRLLLCRPHDLRQAIDPCPSRQPRPAGLGRSSDVLGNPAGRPDRLPCPRGTTAASDQSPLRGGSRRRARMLVGVTGFEPAASSSRTKRASKLRHTPSRRAPDAARAAAAREHTSRRCRTGAKRRRPAEGPLGCAACQRRPPTSEPTYRRRQRVEERASTRRSHVSEASGSRPRR